MRRWLFVLLALLFAPSVDAQTCSDRYTAILTNIAIVRQQVVAERDKKGYVTVASRDAILAGLDLIKSNEAAFKLAGCVTPAVAPVPAPAPVPTPTPTPAPSSSSPDGTRVPPASQIIDSGGHVWVLNGQQTLRDGVWVDTGMGTQYAWCGGVLYVFGIDGAWYHWVASWVRLGGSDPCAAPAPPPPPPPPVTPPPPPAPTGATVTVAWEPPSNDPSVTGYRVTLDGTLKSDVGCCLGGFTNVLSGIHSVVVQSLSATGVSLPVPSPPLTVTVPE